jgi:hypothetical protein
MWNEVVIVEINGLNGCDIEGKVEEVNYCKKKSLRFCRNRIVKKEGWDGKITVLGILWKQKSQNCWIFNRSWSDFDENMKLH